MKKHMDFAEYDRRARKMTLDQIKFAMKDAHEASLCHGENEEYYLDEIHALAQEVNRRGERSCRKSFRN